MIDFEFEELPLLVAGNAEAGLVDGAATITPCLGGFRVDEIYLRAYGNPDMKWIKVDPRSALHDMIVNRLESGRWEDLVRDALAEYRQDMREQAAEERYNMRRDR
jgi:hypothetical protein